MTLERRRTRMSKTEADPTSKLDYSTELICLKTAPSSSWKAGVSLPHAVYLALRCTNQLYLKSHRLQNGYVYCTMEKLGVETQQQHTAEYHYRQNSTMLQFAKCSGTLGRKN